LIDEAMRLGCKELFLVTEDAEPLYRKFDFEAVRTFASPYGEAVLMRKSLERKLTRS